MYRRCGWRRSKKDTTLPNLSTAAFKLMTLFNTSIPSPTGGLATDAASLGFPGSTFFGAGFSSFLEEGECGDGGAVDTESPIFSVCRGASLGAVLAKIFADGFCLAAAGAGAAALSDAMKFGGGSIDAKSYKYC